MNSWSAAGPTVIVVWAGTNDIENGKQTRTGRIEEAYAQTDEYAEARRAAGHNVCLVGPMNSQGKVISRPKKKVIRAKARRP